MAGTISGGHRAVGAITGHSWADSHGQVHRPLSGIQDRTFCGVLLDWHAPEHFDGASCRCGDVEAALRPCPGPALSRAASAPARALADGELVLSYNLRVLSSDVSLRLGYSTPPPLA